MSTPPRLVASPPGVYQRGLPQDTATTPATRLCRTGTHPGERIEQIKKALGVETKDLVLPVKKLLAAKVIKSKGQKRSTTYYPLGSGGLVQVKKGKRPAEGEQKAEG